ncbi:hypothetical protein [Glycomyces paridis]|uniref:Uncharacterized protein n=1 Tax=Glycomyces paridis TaxID=2126555 RepID=A0A4S8NWP3_9ACTN|nr:hypothetical protein [Glycomyces paridis]THV22047.1 hypothetical protein E9998_23795 [Glycomyces paridis]
MKPMLTHPGVETSPIEAPTDLPRRRLPATVLALQALLLAETAALVWIWLWTWHGVQAYAWPGVDNGLFERGLSYLLILAPAVPVNLLAAIWLGRGGRRARLYLAAAGTLAAVQLVLLLTPSAMPVREAMSDGAAAVGIRFLLVVVPILFAGVAVSAHAHTRAWLGDGPVRPRSRIAGVETAVWCLALALAVGTGTEAREWAEAAAAPQDQLGRFAEPGTWARLEDAVADTVAGLPAFTGFVSRAVEVTSCDYANPAGLSTYRYALEYGLHAAEAGADEAAIAALWAEGDHRLTYDGETLEGTRRITAERLYSADDEVFTLTLRYTGGEVPLLHLESPCVERTDHTPECLPAQGDPETDTVEGLRCPDLG